MQPIRARKLSLHLLWLVLASVAPSCLVAAALTRLAVDPGWQGANLLVMGAVALAAGVGVSLGLARDLGRSIADLLIETEAMVRGVPTARLFAAVRELQAVGDALAAAAIRHRAADEPPPLRRDAAVADRSAPTLTDCTWTWDLAASDLRWSQAASCLLGLAADATPSRARLVELAHQADRAALAAWLASAARGLANAWVEFRLTWDDGTPRTIRCTGTPERDPAGRIVAVAGRFEPAPQARAAPLERVA